MERDNLASKANLFLARWATAMVNFATFSMSNKIYNQRELISTIMPNVKWASDRRVLPVQVEDEALH